MNPILRFLFRFALLSFVLFLWSSEVDASTPYGNRVAMGLALSVLLVEGSFRG